MGRLKFEVYTSEDGYKFVRFTEFSKNVSYALCTTKDGHQYVPIPNPYIDKDSSQVEEMLGSDLQGTSVRAVFDGYADSLISGPFNPLSAIMFLDKVVAKEMRKKTMAGWKNTTWRYGVRFVNKNSFGGGYLIADNKKNFVTAFDRESKPILFNTKDEAEKFVSEINNKIKVAFSESPHRSKDADWRTFFDKYPHIEVIGQAVSLCEPRESDNSIEVNYRIEVTEVIDHHE